MGITDGWELAAGYTQPISITALKGARIAIDLPLVIKQLEAGSNDLVRGLLRRTLHLMAHGIRPLMVFEGANVAVEKRRKQLDRQVTASTSSQLPRDTKLKLKRAAKEYVASQGQPANYSFDDSDDVIILESDDEDHGEEKILEMDEDDSLTAFILDCLSDEDEASNSSEVVVPMKKPRTALDNDAVADEDFVEDTDDKRREECHNSLYNFLETRRLKDLGVDPANMAMVGNFKKPMHLSPSKKGPSKLTAGSSWESKSRAIEDVITGLHQRDAIKSSRESGLDDWSSSSEDDEWEEVKTETKPSSSKGENGEAEADYKNWVPNHPEALLDRPDLPDSEAGQRVTGQYSDLKTLFALLGIPFIEAPGEAEHQCVQLAKDKLCDLVYTEDSDLLALDGVPMVRKLFTGEPRLVDLGGLKKLGIVPGVARVAALIAGCDYREGLPGFGISNAVKALISFVPDMESVDKESIDEKFCTRAASWVEAIQAEEDPEAAARAEGKLRARFYQAILKSDKSLLSPVAAYKNVKTDVSMAKAKWGKMRADPLLAFIVAKTKRTMQETKIELAPVRRRWDKHVDFGFPVLKLPTVTPTEPQREDVKTLYKVLSKSAIVA